MEIQDYFYSHWFKALKLSRPDLSDDEIKQELQKIKKNRKPLVLYTGDQRKNKIKPYIF